MNPPLGGSPEPHTNETHRVLLSPLVFCLTGALRETQHLGGYRRLGTPPRYPPPAMNRGRHHGAMRCPAMGSRVHAPGSEREAGSPLASGEVSRVRALPITYAPARSPTRVPEESHGIAPSMRSGGPGAFPATRTWTVQRSARATSVTDHRRGTPSAVLRSTTRRR